MCVSTGNRYLDIGLAVAIGAATGGLGAPGALGVAGGAGGVGGSLSGIIGTSILGASSIGTVTAGVLGGAIIGLGTGVLGAMLTPQQQQYQSPQQQIAQQYNSQNIETTGSGGRQATASLADAIKRSKQRKLTQEDVGDLSIDTGSFANTGLQLA